MKKVFTAGERGANKKFGFSVRVELARAEAAGEQAPEQQAAAAEDPAPHGADGGEVLEAEGEDRAQEAGPSGLAGPQTPEEGPSELQLLAGELAAQLAAERGRGQESGRRARTQGSGPRLFLQDTSDDSLEDRVQPRITIRVRGSDNDRRSRFERIAVAASDSTDTEAEEVPAEGAREVAM